MEKTIPVCALSIILAGCNTPHAPLNAFIKSQDYTAFNLPRSRDGVGTVIDFKNRSESVVATETQCFFKIVAQRELNTRHVAVASVNSTVDWNAGGSFNLPRPVIEYADISGIAKASGAKKVKISFNAPFEQFISRMQFIEYINKLDANDPCKAVFLDDRNLVIYQVFGAKGLSYEFIDGSNNTLSLSAKILDQVDLKPELRRVSENTSKIDMNEPLLIGYRTWIVTKPSGTVGTILGVKELKGDAVEARRGKSN